MIATRRNLMAAVAVLPIAACPAPAIAASTSTVTVPVASDPTWDRLYTAYRAAEADEAETLRVFSALDDAWDAGKASREPAPEKPVQPPLDPKMTLAGLAEAAVAEAPAWNAKMAAYKAKHDAWKAHDDAAYAAVIGDTAERYEAACDACSATVTALMAHPVATLAALAEKAELILTRYGDTVDGDDAKALIADIRRLSAGEA